MAPPEIEEPERRHFSYRTTKDGQVFLYQDGRQVTVLRGRTARKFVTDIERAAPERAEKLMARVTGNFKRGNERPGRP